MRVSDERVRTVNGTRQRVSVELRLDEPALIESGHTVVEEAFQADHMRRLAREHKNYLAEMKRNSSESNQPQREIGELDDELYPMYRHA